MQEDIICAGDILAEVERAELLDAEDTDVITTFTSVCNTSTIICC